MSKSHASTGKNIVKYNGHKNKHISQPLVYKPGSMRPKDNDLSVVSLGDGKMDDLLYQLLTHKTPHGHEHILDRFMPKGYQVDTLGNKMYRVGKRHDSKTMFSCHMDTVHHSPGKIELFECQNYVFGADDVTLNECVLGADDKVGMYIMLKMMEKKIPGLYVFHVGEERGGIGSRHIAAKAPEIVTGIERCIAFDRKDYDNIIIKQSAGMCCSRPFAEALAKALKETECFPQRVTWKPDPTGSFTDSASYRMLIEECTNLSVGYFRQHTPDEHFDNEYLTRYLLPAFLKLDWEKLPTIRKKGEDYERKPYSNGYGDSQYHNNPPVNSKTDAPAGVPRLRDQTKRVYSAWAVDYGNIYAHTEWNKVPVREFTGIPLDANITNFIHSMRVKIVTEGMEKFLTEVYNFLDTKDKEFINRFKEAIAEREKLTEALIAAKEELENAQLTTALLVDLGFDNECLKEAVAVYKAQQAARAVEAVDEQLGDE